MKQQPPRYKNQMAKGKIRLMKPASPKLLTTYLMLAEENPLEIQSIKKGGRNKTSGGHQRLHNAGENRFHKISSSE